jgi:hypothetical protein
VATLDRHDFGRALIDILSARQFQNAKPKMTFIAIEGLPLI